MAATNYSPIQLYYSTTASTAPTAGNLVSGELAINITDGILFYKDNAGAVQTLATKAGTSGTYTSITLSGGTANGVAYLNGSKVVTTGSALTFDGTKLDVVQSGASSGGSLIRVYNSTDGVGAGQLQIAKFGSSASYGPYTANTVGINAASTNLLLGTETNHSVIFYQNNAEGMRLTSTSLYTASGINVGIGASTPLLPIHIQRTSTVAEIRYQNTAATWDAGNTAAGDFEIFTGANKSIQFGVNGSEGMRLTSTGLGIGTSSPGYKLDAISSGATQVARFRTGSTSTSDIASFERSDSAVRAAINYNGTDGGISFWTSTNHLLAFGTNGTRQVILDTSGNLGLGVTPSFVNGYTVYQVKDAALGSSGSSDLELSVNAYYNSGWKYKNTFAASRYEQYNGAHAWFNAASGTAGNAITFTQAMTLDASGNLLVGGTTTPASKANNFINLGGSGGFWTKSGGVGYFGTFDNYAMILATNDTERARIDTSGNLLVGRTSASGTAAGFIVDPAGNPQTFNADSTNSTLVSPIYSIGASAYRFYIGMGGTVYATNTTISAISDQRFKENIQDLDVGLNAIMALKPRKFDWKTGKGKDIKGDRGFIAQEFEKVFPDLVDQWADPAPKNEEPYKSVRQDLIPILVKAMQEQQTLIQQLTARVAALES